MANVINEADHYWCSFETADEFNTWTQIDPNGQNPTGHNCFRFDEDSQAALYRVGEQDGDDWLISPKVSLTGGKQYVVKVHMYYDWPGAVVFTMGSDATVEAQTIVLEDAGRREDTHYVLKLSVPAETAAGDYYFGLHCVGKGVDTGYQYFYSFEVTEDRDGSATFTVTDKDTQAPFADLAIRLSGDTFDDAPYTEYDTTTHQTNGEGKYTFDKLTPGTYYVSTSVDGYDPIEEQPVEVKAGEETQVTLQLEKTLLSTVSGKILDEAGLPISGATVRLKGEKNYEATTDGEGQFTLTDVRRNRTYTLTATATYKFEATQPLEVSTETASVGDITLTDFRVPTLISAEETQKGVFLSWMLPVEAKEQAHDNGTWGGDISFSSSYVAMGTEFREPMLVRSVKWVAIMPDEKIDLYIYALGKDGSRSEKPVFEAKGIYSRNSDEAWNEYQLPEPVACTNGCLIALGHTDYVDLGTDYAMNGTTLYCTDLATADWKTFPVSSLMLRPVGLRLVEDWADSELRCRPRAAQAPLRSAAMNNVSFEIARFAEADRENAEAWTIVKSGFSTLYNLDKDFADLPAGTYQYAVRTNYGATGHTAYGFSAPIEHGTYAKAKITISPNTAIDFSAGTVVTLTSRTDASLVYTAVATSPVVVFDRVSMGDYLLTLKREGFATTSMDVSIRGAFETYAELNLDKQAPFNLQAIQDETTTDVTLTWNSEEGLFEDFEGMDDFAINPAGTLGWTYVDADGAATYGAGQCEQTPYPNMFSPMAFQAFNPTATTPDLTAYMQPHSGNKMLVSASLANGGQNDDYLFSPALAFDADFTLSFYAASGYFATFGNEAFQVGYTTEAPTTENITWLTEQPVEAGAVWAKYTYALPKEARHAVIRCVSNQRLFFLLDDIFIGRSEPETFAMTTFNVTLDNEAVGTTSQREMLLPNLETGKHIAKVQTVYPMYGDESAFSDFAELMFQVEERADGITANRAEMLYQMTDGAIVPGRTTSSLELMDAQGRLCGSCQAGESIRTTGLNAGVYVLKIQAGDTTSFSKVVVR